MPQDPQYDVYPTSNPKHSCLSPSGLARKTMAGVELDMVSILRAGGVKPGVIHCGNPLERLHAERLDEFDPLRKFRTRFCIPSSAGSEMSELVYLAGHSLGLQPKTVPKRLTDHCDKWAALGVEGHFSGFEPWVSIEDHASKLSLDLLGATAEADVVYMNSLTVNLHLMMNAFYRPKGKDGRYKILLEEKAFCSDEHVVQSQVKLHNLDPADAIIHIAPAPDSVCLNAGAIIDAIRANSDSIALILLPGVQYNTGQVFPMQKICETARSLEIPVGLDLAHAVGNVPLQLDAWGVDFACWCSYKYLNSGPGALGGAYLHSRHRDNFSLPRMAGWWGHDRGSRFKMGPEFVPQPGIRGFQLSNPSVFGLTPIHASLEIFADAGISNLRQKSSLMNLYFRYLAAEILGERVTIITPRNLDEHGNQISLKCKDENVTKVQQVLSTNGVVCDTREPDILRAAFVPLYNSFEDIWIFVHVLDAVLKNLSVGLPVPGNLTGRPRKRQRPV